MSAGLAFPVTCPDCHGPITQTTTNRPTPHRTTSIIHCQHCGMDAQIVVTLDVIHRPKYRAPAGCGYRAQHGYTRAKANP